MANAISWFEIPVSDFDRAKKYYSTVFDTEMPEQEIMGLRMAFFPADMNSVGGALCAGEGVAPSKDGVRIYLNGGEDLSHPLSRVESAGGKVVIPKTKIADDMGYFAVFTDTEGNQVGIHSMR